VYRTAIMRTSDLCHRSELWSWAKIDVARTAIAVKILSAHKSNCSNMVQGFRHWVAIRFDC
jgi:hypothetical protein